MLRQHGWNELDVDGVGLIMTDAAIVYKSEAFYGDVLTIEIAVADFSSAGCDVLYRVTSANSGRLIAQAKTGIAFFDYSSKKIAAIPPRFITVFQPDGPHAADT